MTPPPPSPDEIAWLDQDDARTVSVIREHAVAITYVGGEKHEHRTSFAYTTGLFGLGHPELLVLGLDPSTAGALLNEVARQVRAGRDFVPGEVLEFDEWAHRVLVEHLPNPGAILFAANRFYRRPDEASVPAYQLTYDDRSGRFPGEVGYDVPDWVQPRPGSFTAGD